MIRYSTGFKDGFYLIFCKHNVPQDHSEAGRVQLVFIFFFLLIFNYIKDFRSRYTFSVAMLHLIRERIRVTIDLTDTYGYF